MLVERINQAIERHRFLETSDAGGRLTVGVGIYSTDRAHDVGERMIRFAAEAAYLAKQTRKRRVVVYDDA